MTKDASLESGARKIYLEQEASKARVSEAAKRMSQILASLPTDDERVAAICEADVCIHCGGAGHEPNGFPCQCWNEG